MTEAKRRFTDQWDAVDPWDSNYPHVWVKVEHLGRYLFAARYLAGLAPEHVADVGTGTGYGAVELAGIAKRVTAVDADESVIQYAMSLRQRPNIAYRIAHLGTGSPFLPGEQFDAAVFFETLEHLHDPDTALRQLHATLIPGGCLIVSVPNGINEQPNEIGLPYNNLHKRIFSVSSITKHLTDAGFVIDEVLGQFMAADISRKEGQLIRRKITDGRIGDEPTVHTPEMVRRLALVVGYPEPRDVERSYALTLVARTA